MEDIALTCCMSERSKWCADLPVVFSHDEDERQYCVFHAPKGKKGITLKEFNRLIFKKINNAKLNNEMCNLSHTVFEGDISFNAYKAYNDKNSLPSINFENAQFSGGADFFFTEFGGKANFWGAYFKRGANFMSTVFGGEAKFISVQFGGGANFFSAKFRKEANFLTANFSKGAIFTVAQFGGEADFTGAKFGGEAAFMAARLGGDANFKGAQFGGDAGFTEAQFGGDTDFTDAYFSKRADFKKVIFNKFAYFKNLYIMEKIYFEKVNLMSVSFIDTDMRLIDYINCNWAEKVIKIFSYQYKRKVLYDELVFFKEKGGKIYSHEIKKIGRLYRQMKQKYKDEHNDPEVSDWHYGEKEMFRKETLFRRYFPLSISNLYWATCGYGERPVRAGMSLIILIVAIALTLNFFGIHTTNADAINYETIQGFSWMFDIKAFGLLCLTTLQHILFVKAPIYVPSNNYGIFFVTIFSKLFIPIQAALLVMSIRNKFKR